MLRLWAGCQAGAPGDQADQEHWLEHGYGAARVALPANRQELRSRQARHDLQRQHRCSTSLPADAALVLKHDSTGIATFGWHAGSIGTYVEGSLAELEFVA